MAADDFSLKPTWVEPESPEYHNVITKAESYKKVFTNISTTPTRIFKLKFDGLSDTDYATLKTHYEGRMGGYDSFSWTSVPAYIDSGTSKTGRWVDGSLKATPQAKHWEVEIQFEQEV